MALGVVARPDVRPARPGRRRAACSSRCCTTGRSRCRRSTRRRAHRIDRPLGGSARSWTACAAPSPPTSTRWPTRSRDCRVLATDLGDLIAALDVNPVIVGAQGLRRRRRARRTPARLSRSSSGDRRYAAIDGGRSVRSRTRGSSCSTAGSRPSSRLAAPISATSCGRLASSSTIPASIVEVHRAYVDAGADVVIGASYQASYEGLAHRGIDRDAATALLARSVELAREGADGRALVAASVGPYGAVLANGAEYTGDYGLGERRHRPLRSCATSTAAGRGARRPRDRICSRSRRSRRSSRRRR